MKLTSAQIEQTQKQLQADAIPAEHPAMAQLERLFGDHTYFLDSTGLSIVEPVVTDQTDTRMGMVVSLANWASGDAKSLEAHAPEATDRMINLGNDRGR
ncbi:MAG: hypothetical protein LCH93_07705 [Proteobacteria bacterium]|nr:hypothetical protein [Pseudomonadota bacterium]